MKDAMPGMASGVITLSLVWCMGGASQSQDRSSGGSPQPTARFGHGGNESKPGITNTQILLDQIKADKKLLVANNMDLTDAEGAKFWPLYDEYQRGWTR